MRFSTKIRDAQERIDVAREIGTLSSQQTGPRESKYDESGEQFSLGSAILDCIARLLIGALAFLVVGALALLSAIPYGGGSKGLLALLQLMMIGAPIWAVWPIVKAIYAKATRRQTRSKV